MLDKLEYSLLFLGMYVIGLAYVSWKSKYHNKGQEFIIGNRQVGFWGLYGSVISYMRTGSNLAFWFLFVAMMGFGSIWILVSFFTAFALMVMLAPKAQKLSHDNGYITFPDLVEDRQGPIMAMLVNLFSFYGIFVLTVSQLYVAGNILGGLLGASTIIGTLISASIVGLYVIGGGFLSVVRTDIYQALAIALLAIGALLFGNWPEGDVIQTQLFTPNWNMIIGFGLIGFAVPASTDMWQRFFSVKETKIIKPAAFSALLTDIIIVIGLILFIQNMLAVVPHENPSAIFTELFQSNVANPMIVALFGVFIISSVLSTLDNQIFNFTSIFTKNVLRIDVLNERTRFIWILRLIAFLSLLVFALTSLLIENFMQWIIDTYAFVGVITPFMFYSVLSRGFSDKLLGLGVLVSIGCYWALYAGGYYATMYWYAVPYSVPLVFILGDVMCRKFKTT